MSRHHRSKFDEAVLGTAHGRASAGSGQHVERRLPTASAFRCNPNLDSGVIVVSIEGHPPNEPTLDAIPSPTKIGQKSHSTEISIAVVLGHEESAFEIKVAYNH